MTSVLTVFVLGVVTYAVDAAWGKELFRGLFKATHRKDATVPDDLPSFIAGRSVMGRIPTAGALTGLYALGSSLATVHSLLGLMFDSALVFVMLMIGFSVAGFVYRFFDPVGKAKKAIDTLEGLESGAIDPTKTARDAISAAAEKVKGAAVEMMGGAHTPATPTPPTPASTETATQTTGAPEVSDAQEEAVAEEQPTRSTTFDEALERFKKS